MDLNYKKDIREAQKRTMHFIRYLDSIFDQRSAVLLAQSKILSLDEVISIMIQEDSRIRLQIRSG
jgi:hypothetical protein